MYEKLIQSLRHCVECDHQGCATDCQFGKEHPLNFVCRDYLLREAAEAIENTSKAYQMMAEAYEAEVTTTLWIPVTERLPEEYKDVLCYYEYFRYGDYNCMFRTIDRGYYGNGIWGGEAGQGHMNKVLAWMPLPEPPEEMEP